MLLEALVALAIFGASGAALSALAVGAGVAVERARNSERSFGEMNALLNAVALWDTTDLDRHLGQRREGKAVLEVQRPYPTLYDVQIRDTTEQHLIVLRTFLFRERH